MIKVDIILKDGQRVKGEFVEIKDNAVLLKNCEEWYEGTYCGIYPYLRSLELFGGQYKECKFIDE